MLVLGLKEGLEKFAIVCVKTEVILLKVALLLDNDRFYTVVEGHHERVVSFNIVSKVFTLLQ